MARTESSAARMRRYKSVSKLALDTMNSPQEDRGEGMSTIYTEGFADNVSPVVSGSYSPH
jgi:hypothetical protein